MCNNNLSRSLVQDLSDFFGVPSFRIENNTNIKEAFGADDVDFKELIWMIEEKYDVRIEHQDLKNVENLKKAISRYRLNKKNINGGIEMSKVLENQRAVVTGASTGIGREISIQLAKEGAEVILVGRRKEELEKTKDIITKSNGKAHLLIADLREEVVKTGNNILDKFGKIDIIVNVAGVWHDEDESYYGHCLWELPEEQIVEVMQVGILAPMLLTKSLLKPMVEAKHGKIINISGTFESGAKKWLHYYVSKKAIEEFTVGLSEELREHKIQVNAVSPSDTYTEAYAKFYPNASSDVCMDPKDIARLVLMLSMDDFDFITGQTIIARNKNAKDA